MLWGCRHQEDPSCDSKGYACIHWRAKNCHYMMVHTTSEILHQWSSVFTDVTVLSSGHDIMLAQECSEETQDQQWNDSPCHARTNELSPSTRMRWKNTRPTMGWQSTLALTITKWIGRAPRQEKLKGTTGREGYWKPCTSTNSSTPPTWTVVWQLIPHGCCCLTKPTYSNPSM